MQTTMSNSEKKKRITPEIEKEVCEQIILLASRSKNGKVTWNNIVKTSGFSRVSLSNNHFISKAYEEINETKKKKKTAEEEIAELKEKNVKLKQERDKYKNTVKLYDEKYVRWLYNATNANITVEQLNAPVPHSMKTSERLKSVK
jgi:hypothetical protein